MANLRKKSEPAPILAIEQQPRKRASQPVNVSIQSAITKSDTNSLEEVKVTKPVKVVKPIEPDGDDVVEHQPIGPIPRQTDKYVRLLTGSKPEEIKAVRDKVNVGELKYSHYSIDGNNGCYHYLVLKK